MPSRGVRSTRSSLSWLVAIGAIAAIALFWTGVPAQSTGNVHENERFELGDGVNPLVPGVGDIVGAGVQPGPDWDDLFGADRLPKDVVDEEGQAIPNGVPDFLDTFVGLRGRRDAAFLLDDVSAGGRADGSAVLEGGRVGAGVVPSIYDLGNAYAYTTFDAANDLILYAGLERLAPGVGSVVLEFNRKIASVDSSGGLVGERTAGDLQIRADYPAGVLAAVHVSKWVVDEGTGTAGWIAVDTLPINPEDPAEQCDVAGTLCAVCNGATVNGGAWPSYDAEGNPVAQLSSDLFLELGMNLSRLLGVHTYPNYYGTRYAGIRITSYDAAMPPAPKDLALGSFIRASKLAR